MPGPVIVRMHERDNVAIVGNDGGLPAGTELSGGLRLREKVPQAHKVALTDLPAGSEVVRYGVVIGRAVKDLPAGSWVNERVLEMPEAPRADNLPLATVKAPAWEPLEGHTFEGYRNTDGSVGTRNVLAITTTVQCVAGVLDVATERIRRELLPKYPNVDDVVGLDTPYGCGIAIDANGRRDPDPHPASHLPARQFRRRGDDRQSRLREAAAGAPDAAGTAVPTMSLVAPAGRKARRLCLDDRRHHATAEQHLRAPRRAPPRDRAGVGELVVGMQCGGSDAFSGVTANPAVGFCTRPAGARRRDRDVLRSHRGARRHRPAHARAPPRPRSRRRMIAEMALVRRLSRPRRRRPQRQHDAGQQERAASPTSSRRRWARSSRAGSAPIVGVIALGERATVRGLVYAATPASDFICGTLQLAAGMNLHVFTTGRGTPYGLATCPVIKVATRSELARRWHDLMDLDAGPIADWQRQHRRGRLGAVPICCSKSPAAAKPGRSGIGLSNALALFNPAPVT